MTARHLLAVAAVAGALAGCGETGRTVAAATETSRPAAAASSTPVPQPPAAAPSLSTEQVADPGIASRLGPGRLSRHDVTRLMQFFENRVARAYATGRPDPLDRYLAGPMLTGNRATISLLAARHQRNVFRIKVTSVKIQANQAHRVVLDLSGDMTVNYFFDTRTHHLLNHGLPGPGPVAFLVFLDFNPGNSTWYWTGEQSASSDAGGSTGTGASG